MTYNQVLLKHFSFLRVCLNQVDKIFYACKQVVKLPHEHL